MTPPRYFVRLVTTRELERPVQFMGADQQFLENMAREYLKNRGEDGDRFEVLEVRTTAIGSIEFQKVP